MTPGGQDAQAPRQRGQTTNAGGHKAGAPHFMPRRGMNRNPNHGIITFSPDCARRRYCPETAMRTLCLAIALSLALGPVAIRPADQARARPDSQALPTLIAQDAP